MVFGRRLGISMLTHISEMSATAPSYEKVQLGDLLPGHKNSKFHRIKEWAMTVFLKQLNRGYAFLLMIIVPPRLHLYFIHGVWELVCFLPLRSKTWDSKL